MNKLVGTDFIYVMMGIGWKTEDTLPILLNPGSTFWCANMQWKVNKWMLVSEAIDSGFLDGELDDYEDKLVVLSVSMDGDFEIEWRQMKLNGLLEEE